MEPDKDKAEVIIDYSQNYFRVSGNEVFVQKMINQIKPYFEQNLKEVKNEKADVDLSENVERSDLVAETKNRKFEKYFKSGIVKYDAEHDRYEIAASIPGKTNRKKC